MGESFTDQTSKIFPFLRLFLNTEKLPLRLHAVTLELKNIRSSFSKMFSQLLLWQLLVKQGPR